MLVPKRHTNNSDYRYGFQGQEKDDELKGEGNSLNYTFRMHDPRVGRFFTVDPLSKKYAFNSPYAFAENRVIQFNELEGLEIGLPFIYAKYGVYGKTAQTIAVGAEDIVREVVSSTVTVSTSVAIPIINQFNIVRTEGIHAGGAWQKKNYVFQPGVRTLDENWNLVNMGMSEEGNREVFKSTMVVGTTLLPVEKAAAPIVAKVLSKVPARKALLKTWRLFDEFVDISKPVFEKTFKEGDVLYQYRIPGEDKGSYFVRSLDITPEQVGISSSEYTEIYKVTVDSDIQALISTHKKNTPYFKKPDIILEGGGEQVFSKTLKNNSTFEKIN